MEMLRVARDAAGMMQVGGRGGRGAWLCLDGDEGHDAAAAPNLARALRRRVEESELEELMTAMRKRRVQGRSGHD